MIFSFCFFFVVGGQKFVLGLFSFSFLLPLVVEGAVVASLFLFLR